MQWNQRNRHVQGHAEGPPTQPTSSGNQEEEATTITHLDFHVIQSNLNYKFGLF